MSSDASRIRAAADRYGHLVDHIAGRYTNPVTGKRLSGSALLLKIAQGESSALTSDGARTDVSPAGARAWMQFMPSSRAVAIQKYGVDPWRTPEEAVRAATLHLRGKINGKTGLEGYNPGSSSYPNYILGQRVGATHEASGSGGAPAAASPAAPRTSTATASAMPAFDVVSAPEAVQAPVVQASPLTAPKFSAGPTMPAGYQAPVSGGGPVAQEKPADDPLDALPTDVPASSPAPEPQIAPGFPDEQATAGKTLGLALTEGLSAAEAVQVATNRADAFDRKHFNYKWGGGHGGRVDIRKPIPVDCSGAVSAVLGIDPRVSGEFTSWGSAGRSPSGKGITVYANGEHVLMEINGHFFGTSGSNPGGGAGWIPRSAVSSSYLSRFTARHSKRFE